MVYFLVAEKCQAMFHDYVHKTVTYMGTDADKHFISTILNAGRDIYGRILNTNVLMNDPVLPIRQIVQSVTRIEGTCHQRS